MGSRSSAGELLGSWAWRAVERREIRRSLVFIVLFLKWLVAVPIKKERDLITLLTRHRQAPFK